MGLPAKFKCTYIFITEKCHQDKGKETSLCSIPLLLQISWQKLYISKASNFNLDLHAALL